MYANAERLTSARPDARQDADNTRGISLLERNARIHISSERILNRPRNDSVLALLRVGGTIPTAQRSDIDISLGSARSVAEQVGNGTAEVAGQPGAIRSGESELGLAQPDRVRDQAAMAWRTANLLHPLFTFRWSGSEKPSSTTW